MEERAGIYVSPVCVVYFLCVTFCLFSLPLVVMDCVRLVIMTLHGLFIHLFAFSWDENKSYIYAPPVSFRVLIYRFRNLVIVLTNRGYHFKFDFKLLFVSKILMPKFREHHIIYLKPNVTMQFLSLNSYIPVSF